MPALIRAAREIADDHFRGPRRLQLARRHLEAFDRGRRRVIQVAVAEPDAGCALRAEFFLQVDLAVAIRVAQPEDEPGRRRLALDSRTASHGHENVAVRRVDEVSRGAEIVGNDTRAETRRQRQPAVVRVAGKGLRPLSLNRCGGDEREACDERHDEYVFHISAHGSSRATTEDTEDAEVQSRPSRLSVDPVRHRHSTADRR